MIGHCACRTCSEFGAEAVFVGLHPIVIGYDTLDAPIACANRRYLSPAASFYRVVLCVFSSRCRLSARLL